MRFQSIVALTSLVSCAFALTGHNAVHEKAVMEKRQILSGGNLAPILASIVKADKKIKSLTASIKKIKTKGGAVKVKAQLKPLLAQVVPTIQTLKNEIDATAAAKPAAKREIEERQIAVVDNAAIALAVVGLIVSLAALIAAVEVLVATIPVLNGLLIPVLLALNPLLASVLAALTPLVAGLLVIVANLLNNLFGTTGLINLVPLLSGLGNTLGQLLGNLLAGI